MKFIFALAALILAAKVAAEDIQCYVCDDCASGYEDHKETCVAPNTDGGGGTGGGSTGGGTGGGSTGGGTGDGSTGGGTGGGSTGGGTGDGSTRGEINKSLIPSVSLLPEVINNGYSPSRVRLRFVRQATDVKETPRCVVASYEVNGQTKTKRGCSYGSANETTRCNTLTGGNSTQCRVCNGNLCNSGSKTVIAFIPLLVSVIISLYS
nr:keratin, type I cytoskeletal 10-like isoform X1 [Vanessa tameamea]